LYLLEGGSGPRKDKSQKERLADRVHHARTSSTLLVVRGVVVVVVVIAPAFFLGIFILILARVLKDVVVPALDIEAIAAAKVHATARIIKVVALAILGSFFHTL